MLYWHVVSCHVMSYYVTHTAAPLLVCGPAPSIPWAKLIVPPVLAPCAQEDLTSPWLVIVGDPGCPGIACHFLAEAEQSSGPFAPWLMIFFSAPGHVNGTSQVSPTERQSSWPTVMVGIPADQNSPKWRSTGNFWNLAYWISDSLLYWDISHTHL